MPMTDQTNDFNHFAHPALDLVAAASPHFQRKGDVLFDRHMRKQRIALKYHTEPPLLRRHLGHVIAVKG